MHDVSTARQKVKWAYQHIENFEAAYGTYLRENPQRFIANPNASKGSQKPKFVREDLTPPHLVCMIGDAVHNLRSAIDHVAFAIADHNGVTGKNLGIVNFPVREAKSDFNLAIKERKVSQIGAPWVAFLQRVEPYDGGKRSELVAVSLLDNTENCSCLRRFSIPSDTTTLLEWSPFGPESRPKKA